MKRKWMERKQMGWRWVERIGLLVLCLVLGIGLLGGCGKKKDDNGSSGTENGSGTEGGNGSGGTEGGGGNGNSGDGAGTASGGRIFYLNFKPEVSEIWDEIAKEYTAETGVEMKVQTAASGTYEQTLKSEVAKKDAPTLFQINGPTGYRNWKAYCLDLKDTELYGWMLDKSLAVTDGDGVYGIPSVVEGYGIIYNDAIMKKYFALEDKESDLSDASEIASFDDLKKVVEDMTAHKEELGIDGVFASTSFAQGEEWRWHTHLANLPIYYEFRDNGVGDSDTLELAYAENFKNIFDLYIQNSVTEPALLGNKSVNDSMAEFALGRAAMVQNGNWGWGQINEVSGNTVQETDVKFLPIYMGVEGEDAQGLCIGTENFMAVNSKASEADQQATVKFLEWLFGSDKGKDYVTNRLGFITPFNTFNESEKPQDPLAEEVLRYMENPNLVSVSWNFTAFPSQTFKDKLGAAMLEYTQGKKTWDEVMDTFRDEWAAEKAATAQ